ncbi:hypothetical protein D9M69_408170 [compost metagenome]
MYEYLQDGVPALPEPDAHTYQRRAAYLPAGGIPAMYVGGLWLVGTGRVRNDP